MSLLSTRPARAIPRKRSLFLMTLLEKRNETNNNNYNNIYDITVALEIPTAAPNVILRIRAGKCDRVYYTHIHICV